MHPKNNNLFTAKQIARAPGKKPPSRSRAWERRVFQPMTLCRNVRKSKLKSLPPHQLAALNKWLFKDELTYDQTKSRLWEEFGVKISGPSICTFWQRHRQLAIRAHTEENPVLLDVILRTTRPIRLTILRNQLNLITKIQKVKSLKIENG
jgi:hypothetical protein